MTIWIQNYNSHSISLQGTDRIIKKTLDLRKYLVYTVILRFSAYVLVMLGMLTYAHRAERHQTVFFDNYLGYYLDKS